MILHDYALSSACFRVRIALNLKGLAYEPLTHSLRANEQRTPAYLALNPAGLVPLLEVDGARIAQSLAIIDYLDATGRGPRLIPADPLARAQAMAIVLTIACDIHPLNNLRVLRHLKRALGQEEAAVDDWYRHWITTGFITIEALLAERPEAQFVGGDAPGIEDVFLVPQLFNARRYAADLAPFPRLVAVADRANAHPAFIAAAPPATP